MLDWMLVVDWQIIGLLNAFTPQKSFEEFQDVYVVLCYGRHHHQ